MLACPTPLLPREQRLDDYETHQFSDQRVQKPLAKFQQAIEDIETDMVDK